MKGRAILATALAASACAALTAAPAAAFKTSVKPYVTPVGSSYTIDPLLSVGDQVPETSTPANQYRMVGIPDGLGARSAGGTAVDLWMNHELGSTVPSQPFVGGTAQRGAFVSRYRLGPGGDVVSGDRAYDTVYNEDTLIGPAPDALNATPAFGRLCSAYLADAYVGMDRPIFMTGEEASGATTFDGLGGSSVAVFDPDNNPATDNNEAHSLPDMGHFAKENQIVMPGTGTKTVVFPLEDGPAGPESQFYMYVGTKDAASASVLAKNGLKDGRLFVLKIAGVSNEDDLVDGFGYLGQWIEITGAGTTPEAQLEADADAAGAFGFNRIEDGAYSKNNNRDFHFVTTGGGPGTNLLGRNYKLTYSPANPTAPPVLTLMENADTVIAGGGDTAVSPDNLDVSKDFMMVNEDGTSASRPVMASKGRDGSVWRYPIAPFGPPTRVAQLNPPGRDGVAVGPGIWETSGVIDTSSMYGDNTWIMDVQAHPPTAAPVSTAATVEDGQLVLMKPAAQTPTTPATPTTPTTPSTPNGTSGKPKKCKKGSRRKAGKCVKKKCKKGSRRKAGKCVKKK